MKNLVVLQFRSRLDRNVFQKLLKKMFLHFFFLQYSETHLELVASKIGGKKISLQNLKKNCVRVEEPQ